MRVRSIAGLVIMAFGTLVTTAPSAGASLPTAYLQKTQYLVRLPAETGGVSFNDRALYLDRGCYLRSTFIEPENGTPPSGDVTYGQIWLSAGWYEWRDSLAPAYDSYDLWTDLWGTDPPTDQSVWAPAAYNPLYDGSWTWGTSLQWTGNTCTQ
jgi:hypothetical protein